MKLIHQTLICDTLIDDPAILCGHLAHGAWIVEAGHTPPPAHDPERLPAWPKLSSGTALSLSCATALRLSVGPAMIDWLEQAGYPVGPLAALALHELIINAVIHGNLDVSSGHLDAWQDLNGRQAMIALALDDAARAERCVTIALGWSSDRVLLVVADEGKGYEAALPLPASRASGRGMRIARAVGEVEILQGGRQTTLLLRFQPAEADE